MTVTNLRDAFTSEEKLEVKGKPIKCARNTWKYILNDGTICYKLHHTIICKKFTNDDIFITSGGYKTVTTKDRLNDALDGYRIYQIKGEWLITKGETTTTFFDGMILPRDMIPTKKAQASIAKDVRLSKAIDAFVKKTIINGKDLPQPNGGDCWLCMLQSDDKEHLLSHIKENYMHGTLIVNAMRYCGYRDTGIGIYLSNFNNNNHDAVRRAVKKYLKHMFGLVAK